MARHFPLTVVASCVALIMPALAQQLLIVDIQVTGNARLPSAAIIAASGLARGQTATPKDFDAAMARLDNTGLFTSLAYRYDPKTMGEKSGYAVTLQVAEAQTVSGVRLDIPGVEENEIWQEIRKEDGLIDTRIPARQEAVDYYKGAIKAALHKLNHDQDLVAKNEVDLGTGKRILIFQSANLPKIAGVTFEGNQLIDSRTLQESLTRASFLGESYTESYVRVLLDANVTPLYEERGHLTVKFPRVRITPAAEGVTVSVGVDEGPERTLGAVQLTAKESIPTDQMLAAAKFRERKLANWKQIQASLDDAETVLRRDGYMTVAAQVVRDYHDEDRVVDLTVNVDKGKQYFFGSLELAGFDPGNEASAHGLWQLAEGAPMNPLYVDDYLRSLGKTFKEIKSFSTQYRLRKDTNIMDVVVKVTMR